MIIRVRFAGSTKCPQLKRFAAESTLRENETFSRRFRAAVTIPVISPSVVRNRTRRRRAIVFDWPRVSSAKNAFEQKLAVKRVHLTR